MCTSASYRTSVTVVLWKVSLLYTHPAPHGTRSVRFPCSGTPEEKHEESERLKFRLNVPGKEEWFPVAELELSRQWCGGVAPVKILTIIWKASRTWGKHIHTYKIFWYLPNPPMAERIWSKFILGDIVQFGDWFFSSWMKSRWQWSECKFPADNNSVLQWRAQEVNKVNKFPCARSVSPAPVWKQEPSIRSPEMTRRKHELMSSPRRLLLIPTTSSCTYLQMKPHLEISAAPKSCVFLYLPDGFPT